MVGIPTGSRPAKAGRLFAFALALAAPTLAVAERNILEEDLRNVENLQADIRRIGKRESALNVSQALASTQEEIEFLRARNGGFQGRAGARDFCVYAANRAAAERYLKEAQAVLALYQKLFPRVSFLPASPAQILVYPDHAAYLKWEKIPANVAGHTISVRSLQMSVVKKNGQYRIENLPSSNLKQHRLATYQQDVAYVFAHEVSHILTYELVNPGRMAIQDTKTSRFLNEGLAEYFAARLHREVLDKRLDDLRKIYGIDPVAPGKTSAPDYPLREALSAAEYPQGLEMAAFYSEAALFCDWLMGLPDGPNLMGGMLTIGTADRMESLMKQYQRDHGLPADGWAQYLAHRKAVLEKPAAPASK